MDKLGIMITLIKEKIDNSKNCFHILVIVWRTLFQWKVISNIKVLPWCNKKHVTITVSVWSVFFLSNKSLNIINLIS